MSLDTVTLCISFYRNMGMLIRQIEEWNKYPEGLQVILVDDGSPEPALPIVAEHASAELQTRLRLYRIMVDLPWNREEARNLAATTTKSPWLVMLDIDHVLPKESAQALLRFSPDQKHWYRFPRYRVGRADETRKKDALRPDVEFGPIKPHMDGYLVRKDIYRKAGGYDLAFSGCLGGGSEFLRRLEVVAKPRVLPDSMPLHVYTRDKIKDASDWSLSRDTEEGKRRARIKLAQRRATVPCEVRSPWERQL